MIVLELALLVIIVTTVLSANPQISNIVRQIQDIEADGSYNYAFETDNGIFVEEEGKVSKFTDRAVDLGVQGSFLYTSPEGIEIELKYTADEDGFHPEGKHLPTPPPIPPQIQRALDWLEAHPEPQNK